MNAYDKTLTRTIPDSLAYAYGGTATISSKENALFCSSSGGVTAYDKYLTRTVPTKLSAGRNYLSGAMAGNYSLFAGGFDENGVSAVVDVYDLFLTKTASQNLNIPRCDMGATTLHDHAIFAGGRTKSSTLDNTDSEVYRDDVEIYDPYLVLLRPEEGLGEARDKLSAVAIGDSAIFAGGTTGWTSNQLYLRSSSYAEAYEYV